MNIKEFLDLERSHRATSKWFSGYFEVTNDHGVVVKVGIKSHGFYNQILRLNDDPVNYSSGHTIDKVGKMHKFLTETINRIKEAL